MSECESIKSWLRVFNFYTYAELVFLKNFDIACVVWFDLKFN